MSYDGLIVRINGREAIPIRAIPYITCWTISPDACAREFAGKSGAFARLAGLQSYHVKGGCIVQTLPEEWDGIVVALEAFEADIRFRFPDRTQGYYQWRQRSANKLPAGVFVWRDEFESVYLKDSIVKTGNLITVRQAGRVLTYAPMITADVAGCVFADFDSKGNMVDVPALLTEEGALIRRSARTGTLSTSAARGSAPSWYSRYVSISDLSWQIAMCQVDAYPSRWQKDGANNDLRRDIAGAITQKTLLPIIQKAIEACNIEPTRTVEGLPDAPMDAGSEWYVSTDDADAIRESIPLSSDMRLQPLVEESAASTEARWERQRQYAERKKCLGRYKLREAADAISNATGERAVSLCEKLKMAALSGDLPVYEPGKFARYTYGGKGGAKAVSEYYEEAYWDDLNAWLSINEPRLFASFKFPQPVGAENVDELVGEPKTGPEGDSTAADSETSVLGAPDSKSTERPASVQRQQELAIVEEIRVLGLDPLALPRSIPRKPGPKAHVRQVLLANARQLFISVKVFNLAWERLRAVGEIRDAPDELPPST